MNTIEEIEEYVYEDEVEETVEPEYNPPVVFSLLF